MVRERGTEAERSTCVLMMNIYIHMHLYMCIYACMHFIENNEKSILS